ncbi:hypothetical protein [Aulosira sp. FACHB-615]|uniref:hypothetical protein n=1 Tax=Aulosira sp. FACHB-615 TaxID=2692777 RepID=UPI0016839ACE|nr:hypothetical protein [Aulosira sp. FACHB-615]MBD2492490.1 hypothetical protein [Aulosira sp. FACHB-615]
MSDKSMGDRLARSKGERVMKIHTAGDAFLASLGACVLSVFVVIRLLLVCVAIWNFFHLEIVNACAFLGISEFLGWLVNGIVENIREGDRL